MKLYRTLILLVAVLLLSCTDTSRKTIELQSEADLAGLRVGVVAGSYHDMYLTPREDIKLQRFVCCTDVLQALLNEKVDVMLEDEMQFNSVILKEQCIKRVLWEPIKSPTALLFNRKNQKLAQKCSEVQKQMEEDGRMAQIRDYWLNDKYVTDFQPTVHPNNGDGEPLMMVTCSSTAPISFMVENEWYGIEIDIARALADELNRPLVVKYVDYSSAIIALETGMFDLMGGCIFITEEREQLFCFADSYYEFAGAYYVVDYDALQEGLGLWKWLKQSFYRNLVLENRWMFITDGLLQTIKISILSILLGSILGVGLLLMSRSRRYWVRSLADGYHWFVSCIPQLVLLLIMFYVVFSNSGLSPSLVAVVAFAMTFASSVADIYATSLDAVPYGQTEAGLALGFTRLQTFIHIVLPQAVRRGLPLFKGLCIDLLKGTSIVGYIAIQDVTRAGDIVRSRTFDAFVPLLVVTVIYFLLAWGLGKLIELAHPKKHVL